ncbi:MAG: di-trans,poly-cis-decaprenylcistransferase [Verrucomicrobia bacterium]|nr:di-trans,poly-cis-decaprenylcistransferase [Verrucomicrobiota bacterium]
MNTLIAPEVESEEKEILYTPDDLALLDPSKIPSHVAIIMDGNRRWAKRQGLPTMMGHWKGAETLTKIVRAASELGIKTLTVYSFSTENWGRAKEEVDALMHLFKVYLEKQREPMLREGVRLDAIGDLKRLPPFVLHELERSRSYTAQGKKIDLVLAMNYGGRDDIRRAFVAMMGDFEKGKLSRDQVSEQLISQYLDTAKWPDPELLIRTSGERRQSNFLLWQLCYSEFYHTDVLWPDFDQHDLLQAVREHQLRQRRLGG